MSMNQVRLGVNIDHIATLRNARGHNYPNVVDGAILAQNAGGDGITAHLREDRRHIKDGDIYDLKKAIKLPLNFEMAATDEMRQIALDVLPNACCIVPEKREELTTEGGLDLIKNERYLSDFVKNIKDKNIRISLFVEPNIDHIKAAKNIGADIVEIHTGKYCLLEGDEAKAEFDKINKAAQFSHNIGIEAHAGHGLNYQTAKEIVQIDEIIELNIGHFLICDAVFIGLDMAVKKMKKMIEK